MNPSPTGAKKRIYIAGPMQGYPEFNFPRFNAVAACMRLQGNTVVFNPAEKDIERHNGTNIATGNATGSLASAKAEHGFNLRQALKEDTAFICGADAIIMLPGWEKSNGAQAEHRLAVALITEGMEIVYLHEEVCKAMETAHKLLTKPVAGGASNAA